MEDMNNRTDNVVKTEDVTEVEENSEKGGYIVLLLVAGVGAIAGHFIEKGFVKARHWVKGKMDAASSKRAEAEKTANDDPIA